MSQASDERILGQLQTLRADIKKLRYNIRGNSSKRSSLSKHSLERRSSPQTVEQDGFTTRLFGYIESAESFVSESTSTVYFRSTTSSEVSQKACPKHNYTSISAGRREGVETPLERLQKIVVRIESNGEIYLELNRLNEGNRLEAVSQIWTNSYWLDKDVPDAAFKAVIEDDLNILRVLIEHGVDVNRHYKALFGITLLHCAACLGHEAIVNVLLESGANINARDDLGTVPIQYALVSGHDDIACLLIHKGAETKCHISAGISFIHHQIGEITYSDSQVEDGWSILIPAAAANCTRTVQLLIDRGETEATTRNEGGFTALHGAAGYCSWQAATILIDNGFDIEARTAHDGFTPLMFAANGTFEVFPGEPVFSRASHEDGIAIVKLLLDRGARINAKSTMYRTTAYEHAVAGDNFEVARFLRQKEVEAPLGLVAGLKSSRKSRSTSPKDRSHLDSHFGGSLVQRSFAK
jgi:ankyrin repeat protein